MARRSPLVAAASAACVLASSVGFSLAAGPHPHVASGPHVIAASSVVAQVGAARRARPSTQPSAALSLTGCVSAPTSGGRLLKVRAVMAGVSGTGRMAMRFHLGETTARSREKELAGPGLGAWETLSSAKSTTRWTKDKTVAGLAPSAYYRVWVDFRWLSSAGREINHRSIAVGQCVQVDVRPDLSLAAGSVKVTVAKSGKPGRYDYEVTVRNIGRGPSPLSKVRVIVPGQTPSEVALGQIGRGLARTVTLLDVAGCSSGSSIVSADPEARTGDPATTNNLWTVPCN